MNDALRADVARLADDLVAWRRDFHRHPEIAFHEHRTSRILQERLAAHYRNNPDFVRPKHRYNEALSFIEQGLDDISISRATLKWGISVPWDPSQVIYVWVDALINYLSALHYAPGEDLVGRFWPPDCPLNT